MAPALPAQPPSAVAAVTSVASAVPSAVPTGWQQYTVRSGDTLWDIARRAHTTTSAVVTANRLPAGGRLLQPGQVVLVPTAAGPVVARPAAPAASPSPAPATTPATTTTYVVRPGDTLSTIATHLGVSQASLAKANGLRAPYLLVTGRTLTVVRAVSAAPVPGPTSLAGRTYPADTVAAADRSRGLLAAAPAPSRTQVRAIIEATARQYGVDPRLALAVGYLESGWNQRMVSPANAVGAMQVIPDAGQWASQLAGRPLNLLDAHDNAVAGVVILRALTRSADSLDQAVAGYYQGLASVRAHGMYDDTKAYVAHVTALMPRV
ncbi:LysM peptidoglycan-binding domain-containing protein [Lapillicoccus jejuensis]|uniref:LysM domain-containing protein n=1 Tax=Lapillicoccus jejuensis TaxID=402171 RepID=A0A542E5L1_9MICO|nr:LysM peptidoglycan-binding domain-containing protein [Lapillicoccus jejuensis]TQJ10625.1 LysM domain-containing protein [Lapillicoccus jejuensis]